MTAFSPHHFFVKSKKACKMGRKNALRMSAVTFGSVFWRQNCVFGGVKEKTEDVSGGRWELLFQAWEFVLTYIYWTIYSKRCKKSRMLKLLKVCIGNIYGGKVVYRIVKRWTRLFDKKESWRVLETLERVYDDARATQCSVSSEEYAFIARCVFY